jgi:hypothetical protein
MDDLKSLITEIEMLISQLKENYELTNAIDTKLRENLFEKLAQLPNGDEIKAEFDKIFNANDESDTKKLKSKREKRSIPAVQQSNFETERKQTCVELFADFGIFFNKSISKVGLKYCSETEIVRRGDESVKSGALGNFKVVKQ